MLSQHLTEYFEECVYCGKDGLKRSHASLYEVNGILHICKTIPSWNRKIAYEKLDSTTHQNDGNEDIVWNVDSEVGGEGELYWYSDSY
jgi:hypothetical protein